jgi:hypothetical protein
VNGNHWTIFNGAGVVVADNMPLDVVHAYMTPERFARGWQAVFCVIVNSEERLAEVSANASAQRGTDEHSMRKKTGEER